jgi:hypothetical protein
MFSPVGVRVGIFCANKSNVCTVYGRSGYNQRNNHTKYVGTNDLASDELTQNKNGSEQGISEYSREILTLTR